MNVVLRTTGSVEGGVKLAWCNARGETRRSWLCQCFPPRNGGACGVGLTRDEVHGARTAHNNRVNLTVRPVTGLANRARPAPARPAGYAERSTDRT